VAALDPPDLEGYIIGRRMRISRLPPAASWLIGMARPAAGEFVVARRSPSP